MNATIVFDYNGSWSYLVANNDDLPTNDNGSRILRLSHECKLFIMNSIYQSKQHHRHTCYSPIGFTKRVDYILTEWHIKKRSSNCRVYRRASIPFESDHRFLALTCSFPSKCKQKLFFRKPTNPKKIFTNIKSLKDDTKVLDNFSTTVDGFLQSEPSITDIDSFEKYFT